MNTEAIKARYEATSKGEWATVYEYGKSKGIRTEDGFLFFTRKLFHYSGQDKRYEEELRETKADASFIVHAHQDIPALLKEVGRLKRSMTDLVFAFGGVTLKDADDSLYEALEYQIEQLKQALKGE